MGGVILLLIMTVVLCIVILCMRRSHGKKESHVVDNTTKLKVNVTTENYPTYDDTKADTVDNVYDTINPGGSDAPITTNPSYNIHTKPLSKTSENKYSYMYVQPNSSKFIGHSDVQGIIKMDADPSYGANTRGDRATAFSVISDTKAHQSSHNATTKQYDYAYVHDDHLLHHSKPCNATDDDVKGTLYI